MHGLSIVSFILNAPNWSYVDKFPPPTSCEQQMPTHHQGAEVHHQPFMVFALMVLVIISPSAVINVDASNQPAQANLEHTVSNVQ
jgi:hypothetical protein